MARRADDALERGGVAARGGQPDEAAQSAFLVDYTANAAVDTRAFDGATETMRRMADAGWRFALCTNKPEVATLSLLAALDLAPGRTLALTGERR